ncbi:DNA translocase FtsK 4TM domain-containing protein [Halomonas beimenensis]|uniref:DNA translocase FtsK n=2 Tax=Halomonas beimenensis TaxID=475662 RepID=A0A291P974_9GAMM|nr:DNA translocase FtsK 4TM domain-containing protein [Halomonas beimenensis]ATJ83434.1 DNA translocase FtsK [Halomonas beimenensis]
MRRKGDGRLSAQKKSASHRRAATAKETARRFGLRLQGSVREGAVILLLSACVFLLLALYSFRIEDPGWSRSGPETEVANWMGPIGAWLADVLYSLFGVSALWWPGMLGFAAWWLIRARQVRLVWDATALAVRCGGLVLLLLGTTTLGALHFYHPASSLPYAAGGILGEGLVGALLPLVGAGGTSLLALAAMLCGVPLFTGWSWLTIMDEIGHRALAAGRWVADRFALRRSRDAEADDGERPAPRAGTPEVPAEPSAAADTPRPAWWRRWRPGRRSKALEPAAEAGRREPGFGDDGDTEIPWDVPEHTPSAKRPEAAYAAREPRLSLAASGESPSRRAEPEAPIMPLRATEEPEPASPPPRPEAFSAPGESPAPPGGMSEPAGRPEAGESGATPAAPAVDDREQDELPPRASAGEEGDTADRGPADAGREASAITAPSGSDAEAPASAGMPGADIVPERASVAVEAGRHGAQVETGERRVPEVIPDPVLPEDEEDDAPAPPRPATAPDAGRTPPGVEAADAAEGRRATADQAREAAADDDGPTLWTVEHLQNQRPVFEDLDEPEGALPSLRLLTPPKAHQPNYSDAQLAEMAELLETRLREYGVKAEVVDTWPGPVITRFEIKPAAGVKVSKISNLAKDLARSLMVKSVRVVEVIPGRPTVGIEIPNPQRAMIRLREVIDSDRYQHEASALTLALGQDIGGGPVVANLGKMPHLLVAGTTGSGKSVGVNAMLISMLLKATPEEVRMIMVDPKMLELSVYDGIPHLLAPVVTDMKEAANALRWCVAEMERRYKLMAAMGVRNIAGFNAKLDEAEQAGAQVADPLWEPQPWEMHQAPPVLEKLPYIVVVIDEFADMFMIVGKKVEELIARLAQKARAAGIHLILATQRPSVDVVTGLIKANIPTRMAFQVSSRVDSRTILDQGGAENLLGHGDMLYLPAGSGMPTRVHGAFVDDDEVHRVVEDWKRRGEPEYIDEILSGGVSADALAGLEAEGGSGGDDDPEQDALYDEAVAFVTESRRASISAVQRRFKIGYNRAARLVEAMEMAGVVSTMGTNGAREVLAPPPAGD